MTLSIEKYVKQGKHLPRTVALHPSILGEDKARELLSKVLNHVVTFRLAVDEEVKSNLLLEVYNTLNLLLDEFLVLVLAEFTFAKFGTSLTNLLGLLSGTHKRLYRSKKIRNIQGKNQ